MTNNRQNVPLICTKKPFELNNDLIIQRHHTGIRLIKPSNDCDINNSIGAFNDLDASVYFVDAESTILQVNPGGAELNGLLNITDMNGKNVTHFLKKDFSGRVFEHDQAVLASGKTRVFEESGSRQDEGNIHSVAVRFPWFHDNKIIGIFGICASVASHSLSGFAASMEKLITSSLISSNDLQPKKKLPQLHAGKTYYSKRELEVIDLMIMGKSTKEIANILFLSKRTVEHHIENIKFKAGCSTRYQLIHKLTNNA